MAARNNYSGSTGFELGGRRLGLQAFGQSKPKRSPKAKGLGMTVTAFDPYCPDEVIQEPGCGRGSRSQRLAAASDILSIHIPATPQTKGSIGEELIGALPKGAVIINTARKEVIDKPLSKKMLEAPRSEILRRRAPAWPTAS